MGLHTFIVAQFLILPHEPLPPEDDEWARLGARCFPSIGIIIRRSIRTMESGHPLFQCLPRLADPHALISLMVKGAAGVALHERQGDLVHVKPFRWGEATPFRVVPIFRRGVWGTGGDQAQNGEVALSHRLLLLRGILLLLRRALSGHHLPALAPPHLGV